MSYIVKAQNILRNKNYKASFDTEIEANEWLQKHIEKETFGLNARQVIKGLDDYDPSLFLSEFEDTDINGNVRMIVSLKAEYTYDGPTLVDGSGSSEEDKEIRKKSAQEKITVWKRFKEFGQDVELYFTGLINDRNYTQEQKDAVQSNADVLAVLQQLQFGRIGKAKSLIDVIVADNDLFFEEDLQAVSKFMEDFLSEL